MPLLRQGLGNNLVGALLIGANSRLRLDSEYLDFLTLIAWHLVSSGSLSIEFVEARCREPLWRENINNRAKKAIKCENENIDRQYSHI